MCRPEIGVYAKGYDRHEVHRQGVVIGHSAVSPTVFFLKGFSTSRIFKMLSGGALAVQPLPRLHESFEPECSADADAIAVLNRKRLELIK